MAGHLYDKKMLLATICHDLGSPMSVILHSADRQKELIENLIKKQEVSAEDSQKIDLLTERHALALSQAFEIINQVRLLEALDNGKTTLCIDRVDLVQVVAELSAIFSERLTQKNLHLEVNLEHAVVLAERNSLVNSVLANLLSNAIKFSHEGGVIGFASRKNDEGYAVIEISDNGVGMSETLVADIFSIERKTTRLGTSGERGTGLGLPIVRRFVDAYDGKILVSSNADAQRGPVGTVFTLVLPAADAAGYGKVTA